MEEDEDYEVIPVSPLRTLDRRVARVEAASTSSEVRRLIEQVLELIKANQRIIDDIIKSDAELRNEVARLPGKIDELVASMHEFIDILKASASEEGGRDMEPLLKRIGELVELMKKTHEVGQATLTSLDTIDKRLKRSMVSPGMVYRRPAV
ncbi:MAG: hypothetical protein HY520_03685 [Candidatus Aenigmarchaeota archaeon]|nr:hypothetical protein [Candidatus Aenigmarchaeota archaeon]